MTDKSKRGGDRAAVQCEIKYTEQETYQNASNVIKQIMLQYEKKFISGKVVGYINNCNYKVILADGRIGIIECEVFDKRIKVRDYRKRVFTHYIFNELRSTESEFIRHINQEYYFEIIEENLPDTDNLVQVNIDSVREIYLDYIIKNKNIVKGTIIQIGADTIAIEIPYRIVFITKKYRVFGCECDSLFDYNNYLEAEVSVIIEYNAQDNKLYPRLANLECSLDKMNRYIFPSLRIYNGANISRLWLDKDLQMYFMGKERYSRKGINRLYVIQGIREKGEISKTYKGIVKRSVSLRNASRYRMSILAVGWLKNLGGYNIKDAICYLEDNGFMYQISYQYDTLDKGIVLGMHPDIKDTKMISRNTIIFLKVSQGKRKEYVLPDLTGVHVETVKKILENNKIKMKKIITYEKQDNIKNGCIIQTVPAAGSIVLAKGTVELIVYQEKKYASPFVLRDDEVLDIDRNNLIMPKWVIDQICVDDWKKIMLEVLLKHKVITALQIKHWFAQHKEIEYPEEKMNECIQELKKKSLVGTARPRNSEAIHFLFPLNNLYEHYEGACYNGKFSVIGKDLNFFKTRCAENQALFKLCSLLMGNYIIEYEVDCMQSFVYKGEKEALKVHIAVNVKNKADVKTSQVYFIEAIRFLNDEQVKDSWTKIDRYEKFLDRKFAIKPRLLLVFEDKDHYQDFFLQKPSGLNRGYMEIYNTWDSMTNMQGGKFKNVFIKGIE